jgi:hypothetical protein
MIARNPPVRRIMGEVIGRQPAKLFLAPSRQYPWYGDIIGAKLTGFGDHSVTGGERFTTEQAAAMSKLGLVDHAVEVITVRRSAAREIYHGLNPPGVYEFECPVTLRRRDGKVMVISPSGAEVEVSADGWVSPPRHRMGRPA